MRVLALILVAGLSGCAGLSCPSMDPACQRDLASRREAVGAAMMGLTVATSATGQAARMRDDGVQRFAGPRTPRGSGYRFHVPDRCVEVRDPMLPGHSTLSCY